MNTEHIYYKKLYKFFLSLILYIIAMVLIEYIVFGGFARDKNGSIVLAIISIPSCILYYKIKQKDILYLYILLQLNIIIDHIINWSLVSRDLSIIQNIECVLIYRTILLLSILKSDKLPKCIIKNKNIVAIFTIIVGVLSLFLGNGYLFNIFKFQLWLEYCYNIFVLYAIIKVTINAFRKKNFIETIYIMNLITIIVGRILMIFFKKSGFSDVVIFYNEHFFNIAFFILILGLYIELEHMMMRNKKLNDEVHIIATDIKEIKSSKEMQRNYFTNLAHELKTPINIIFSCVQYLDSQKNKETFISSYSKYSSTLKQNCYRMIRIVNNLLDITKMKTGHFNIEFNNHDIVSLVEDITLSIIPYVKNADINIIFDTTVEELIIACDNESIERVVLNLLSNAIKYTNSGGEIIVFLDREKNNVLIKVIDTGIGIPESKQANIFDLYVQGDVSLARLKEGSGIGLSLVKSIVELHKGNVYIQESSKNGTVMVVELPIKTVNEHKTMKNNYNLSSNNITDRINIEFSDIYDIQ